MCPCGPAIVTPDTFPQSTTPAPSCIRDVTWTSLSVSDSSNYPCDLNTISVAITPAVSIYQACADYVELTGFTGTMTADSSSAQPQALTGTSTQNVFNSDAEWTMADGKLRVFLNADLVAGTSYTFQFEVRNSEVPQPAQDISINVPLVSDTNQVLAATSGDNVLDILEPDWDVEISSSTAYPCAHSTIRIHVTPRIAPIQRHCDPSITVAGILGTTLMQTELDATDLGTQIGFASVMFWTPATGSMEIHVAPELTFLDIGVQYVYEFMAYNQPTSNPAQAVTFTNPDSFSTDTTVVAGSAQGGSFGFMEIYSLSISVCVLSFLAPRGFLQWCLPRAIACISLAARQRCIGCEGRRVRGQTRVCSQAACDVFSSGFSISNFTLPVLPEHNHGKRCLKLFRQPHSSPSPPLPPRHCQWVCRVSWCGAHRRIPLLLLYLLLSLQIGQPVQ